MVRINKFVIRFLVSKGVMWINIFWFEKLDMCNCYSVCVWKGIFFKVENFILKSFWILY